MNQQELQQKIAEFYAKLPPKAQEIFYGMGWLETLRGISTRYGLNEDQIQTIGTETMLVLLSLIHIEEYEAILQKEISLPKEKMEVMMQEINTMILSPIRPELMDTFNQNNSEKEKIDNQIGLIEPKIDPRFEKLPKNIRQIIEESNYQNKIYEVSKKYNLTIAQIAVLEGIITDTLLGSIHPEEFASSVQNNLGLEPEKIKLIVEEINEKILREVRNKILTDHHNEVTNSAAKSLEDSFQKDSQDIFKSVGIELVSEQTVPEPKIIPETQKITLNALELPSGEDLKEIVAPVSKVTEETKPTPSVVSILDQKLGGSFKIDSKVSEHSLENVTKKNNSNDNTLSNTTSKVDPYRMPIE